MPTFYYKAKDMKGQNQSGQISAFTQDEAAKMLQKEALFVTALSAKPLDMETKSSVAKKSVFKQQMSFFGKVSHDDKLNFNVQLANMVDAGLPLLRALHAIIGQMRNPAFHKVLENVANDVEGGMTFSEALGRYPKVFPTYFTSSVKAGELSGQLGLILQRVATFTEHDMEVRQSLRAAFTYPIILMLVGAIVIVIIITVVIPNFVSTFLRIGIELPLPTRIMYGISTVVKTQWMYILGGIAGTIFFLRVSSATAVGKLWLDQFSLSVPYMGDMVTKFTVSRFARTLSMLLRSGVPILQSLDMTKQNVDNKVFGRATDIVYEKVKSGVKMADAMKEAKLFPDDMIQMVAVGVETGKLDDLLERTSNYYDMTAKYSLKRFVTMIEPLFLLVLGTVIAFIMASVLLPIFDMMKILKQA